MHIINKRLLCLLHSTKYNIKYHYSDTNTYTINNISNIDKNIQKI